MFENLMLQNVLIVVGRYQLQLKFLFCIVSRV